MVLDDPANTRASIGQELGVRTGGVWDIWKTVNSKTPVREFLRKLEQQQPDWLLAQLPFTSTPKGNSRDHRALHAIQQFALTQAKLGGYVWIDAPPNCAAWEAD